MLTSPLRALDPPDRGPSPLDPAKTLVNTCADYYHTTIISLPDVYWSMAHGRLPCTDCTRCVPPQLRSNGTATPTVVREPQLHFMPVYQLYR